ncbi:branched-chain amino acid aminotransferase [Psychrobacillus sp. L3]|uniref:branched-chain amino acid aminotransferase n=1 Tax=Psychrobacillus sp. L3 TaxID=3236891 RepID=UPI0036F37D5A
MITKKIIKKIEEATSNDVELLVEEKQYADKHSLLADGQNIVLIDKNKQFSKANIERFNKETDELISKDTVEFLKSPIVYFKEKQNEYLYLESDSFDVINVDAIALEFDEVFEVYTAMFGLALQKKFGPSLHEYLKEHFHTEIMNYSLMFSGEDGLWEVNLPLNYLKDFSEDFTLEETLHHLFSFIFSLVEATEN